MDPCLVLLCVLLDLHQEEVQSTNWLTWCILWGEVFEKTSVVKLHMLLQIWLKAQNTR